MSETASRPRGNWSAAPSGPAVRAALLFTVALLAFEALILTPGYGQLLDVRLSRGNAAFVLAAGTFIASTVIFLAFVAASLRARRPIRLLYFAVFAIAASVEYAYQYGFDRFSDVSDYEVGLFAVNSQHVTSAIASYANFLVLVPCAVYAWLLLRRTSPQPGRGAAIELAVFAVTIAALAAVLSLGARSRVIQYPAISMVASFRTLLSVPWMLRFDPGPRPAVTYRAPAPPEDNIIFVVAESIRGDHLSINGYHRATTPFLEELRANGRLTNWGIAVAATTCSVPSNLSLLTGTPPGISHEAPTIFQYAKAMGYRTHYIDGQMTKAWNGHARDRATWDVWLTANEFNTGSAALTDSRIGARVADIINTSTGNFIWITKFGVHTSYDLDYPPGEAVWTPVYGGRGVALTPMIAPLDVTRRQAFVNSYDNAVRWSVESFFRALFARGVPDSTIVVYTSDHGQTLGEGGEKHSHCGASKTEAMVPLFVISSRADVRAADTTFPASHSNIFATLLDLMGFPESERPRSYDVSLLGARSPASVPRTYLAAGKTVPFD
jgi:glucan phosphoethanolaminetransferase (alkaline phosphatase superfamily)